jgi:hypothetical protein
LQLGIICKSKAELQFHRKEIKVAFFSKARRREEEDR